MSTDQQVTSPPTRQLGANGPEVSALGVGTWALGGPFTVDGRDAGWGVVDDRASIRALHTAIDHGAALIDTAAVYGTGHSERIIGQALAQLPSQTREQIVVATKFGHLFDEQSRAGAGSDISPQAIRAECEASLRRLGTETIGVYQLHGGADGSDAAEGVVSVLEELVDEGKIRWFGTSQDAPEIISVFALSRHAVAVQSQVNVFGWSQSVLELAGKHRLAVLARSPLAMGLLSGRYSLARRPAAGDVRLDTPWWTYFDDDAMVAWLARLASVRELLTTGGRSLVQGALGYLWALDEAIIPLPGIRTPAQAEENVGALRHGPLPAAVAAEVTDLLADSPERRR
ncbi:aldo/keto reductase [Nesterenkonia ebinurensis]|uniref:aldo/keto reductase n=1 Tax=Nesterenkonia ebinurensis TaxID=2608252 RepID=UPI00123CCDD0|nr:aldo/keto reductase [Nesterenkonia ebinurensis]